MKKSLTTKYSKSAHLFRMFMLCLILLFLKIEELFPVSNYFSRRTWCVFSSNGEISLRSLPVCNNFSQTFITFSYLASESFYFIPNTSILGGTAGEFSFTLAWGKSRCWCGLYPYMSGAISGFKGKRQFSLNEMLSTVFLSSFSIDKCSQLLSNREKTIFINVWKTQQGTSYLGRHRHRAQVVDLEEEFYTRYTAQRLVTEANAPSAGEIFNN